MSAGPELDALVAGQVMGKPGKWVERVRINDSWVECKTWLPDGYAPELPPCGSHAGMQPNPYSTDIAFAWKVVEKIKGDKGVRRM